MTTQPTRRRIEPGVYERRGADGSRVGLDLAYDAAGKARRRTVHGGVPDARDALATASPATISTCPCRCRG
jgi:hypothetical protein